MGLIFTSCWVEAEGVEAEIEYNPELFSFENNLIYYDSKPYSGVVYGNGTPPYKLIRLREFDSYGDGSWTSKIEKGSWSNYSVEFDGSSNRKWGFGWNESMEKMTDKSFVLKIEKKKSQSKGSQELYSLDYYFIINKKNSNDSIINSSIRVKATTLPLNGEDIVISSGYFIEGFTTSILNPKNYLLKESKRKYDVSKQTPAATGKYFISWTIYDESLSPLLTSAQILEEKREKEKRERISNCRMFVENRIRSTGNFIQSITQDNFPYYTYIVLNSDNLKNYIYRVVVNNNCDDIQSMDISSMN